MSLADLPGGSNEEPLPFDLLGWMDGVRDDHRLSHYAKVILIAMGLRWPKIAQSQGRIARDWKIGLATVSRHMPEVLASGWVRRTNRTLGDIDTFDLVMFAGGTSQRGTSERGTKEPRASAVLADAAPASEFESEYDDDELSLEHDEPGNPTSASIPPSGGAGGPAGPPPIATGHMYSGWVERTNRTEQFTLGCEEEEGWLAYDTNGYPLGYRTADEINAMHHAGFLPALVDDPNQVEAYMAIKRERSQRRRG